MNKKIIIFICFVFGVFGFLYFFGKDIKSGNWRINSYDACLNRGGRIPNDNPYLCITDSGKIWSYEKMPLIINRPKNQKICPDAWFDNKMPVIGEAPIKSEYFVINGERWEYNELDVNWVKQNCEIKEPINVF